MIKRFLSWLFWNTNISWGPLAPYILGASIGRWPHRVREKPEQLAADENGRRIAAAQEKQTNPKSKSEARRLAVQLGEQGDEAT